MFVATANLTLCYALNIDHFDGTLFSNSSLCWLCLEEEEKALDDAMKFVELCPKWGKAYYIIKEHPIWLILKYRSVVGWPKCLYRLNQTIDWLLFSFWWYSHIEHNHHITQSLFPLEAQTRIILWMSCTVSKEQSYDSGINETDSIIC